MKGLNSIKILGKGGDKMKGIKRILISLIVATVSIVGLAVPVSADPTADVTLTATPKYVAITDNVTSYDFGAVDESQNYTMATGWVGITNSSSTQTDVTIRVTTTTWSGGVTWAHSDTATIGTDTAGLVSSNGTGALNIIVKNAAPNDIYTNLPSGVNFTYETRLNAPSAFTDGVQKSITLRITAAAG